MVSVELPGSSSSSDTSSEKLSRGSMASERIPVGRRSQWTSSNTAKTDSPRLSVVANAIQRAVQRRMPRSIVSRINNP
jgi:hypothetical protein